MNTAIQALPTYIQEKVATATVPIKYTAAVKALAECRGINEAKHYADKSDALAAWAKIYKHDEAALEAKKLKLHAFRRMGELAEEIQPTMAGCRKGKSSGKPPGARGLLIDMGLTQSAATSCSALARMPDKKFNKIVKSNTPHGPSYYQSTWKDRSNAWRAFHTSGRTSGMFLNFTRTQDPKELARGMTPSEAKKARKTAIEIIEWLDTFEQYLK